MLVVLSITLLLWQNKILKCFKRLDEKRRKSTNKINGRIFVVKTQHEQKMRFGVWIAVFVVVNPAKNKVEKYKSQERNKEASGAPRVVSGDKSG